MAKAESAARLPLLRLAAADPLAPPVDLREALEQIGRDVMEAPPPRRAMQELLRRGSKKHAKKRRPAGRRGQPQTAGVIAAA